MISGSTRVWTGTENEAAAALSRDPLARVARAATPKRASELARDANWYLKGQTGPLRPGHIADTGPKHMGAGWQYKFSRKPPRPKKRQGGRGSGLSVF